MTNTTIAAQQIDFSQLRNTIVDSVQPVKNIPQAIMTSVMLASVVSNPRDIHQWLGTLLTAYGSSMSIMSLEGYNKLKNSDICYAGDMDGKALEAAEWVYGQQFLLHMAFDFTSNYLLQSRSWSKGTSVLSAAVATAVGQDNIFQSSLPLAITVHSLVSAMGFLAVKKFLA